MTTISPDVPSLGALDEGTRALVRLSAVITAGSERDVRDAMADAAQRVRAEWVEELVLQSYLFAGFPRALNAMREWRKASGVAAPPDDPGADLENIVQWQRDGETTCETVYGRFYERLRHNIRELHPALDAWMIVDGYGKVLSRSRLDLRRRELCVVAACAAAQQDRQLHSHLFGALHCGASPAELIDALELLDDLLPADVVLRYRHLLARVLGK
jgi:4-carboxymuconolactone decarboxylase